MWREPSLLYLLEVGFWFCVAMQVIDWLDGASRWQRRQEAENKRVLAEGWKKWATDKES
jgi:hypothetical protein